MVRIVAVLGARDHDLAPGSLGGSGTGTEATYTDERLDLAIRFHDLRSADQPAAVPDGTTRVWLLGDVYGAETSAGYEPRPDDVDAVTYVADQYAEDGRDCFARLNGEYAALVYDPAAGEAAVATDRVGSRPVFATRTAGGAVAVASSIQALARLPGVETRFDEAFLREYLAFSKTFGLRTPLEGVWKLQPGAVTAVDLSTGETSAESYWRPVYDPVDRPVEAFVDRFADVLETVLSEWTRPDRSYGLLLSGGSDSRALLSAFDHPVSAYHIFDWLGREASLAERVAMAADTDLTLLRRPEDHLSRTLEAVGDVSNFAGWFSQSHAEGFHERIADDVDVLVSGLYADTLFKDEPFRKPRVSLSRLGTVELPVALRDGDVSDAVDRMCEGLADGLSVARLRSLLADNVERRDGSVIHHGVAYDSLDELLLCSSYYPLSNDTDRVFTDSVRQRLPYRIPYLDNRLIDLHLTLPIRHRTRANVVDRYIERSAPDLAAIPHAETGVAPRRSFPVTYVGKNLLGFWRKHLSRSTPPAPHLQEKSWLDVHEALRHTDVVPKTLTAKSDLLEALPGVSAAEAWEWYEGHLAGEHNTTPLMGLLTVLGMPVTETLCDGAPAGSDAGGDLVGDPSTGE